MKTVRTIGLLLALGWPAAPASAQDSPRKAYQRVVEARDAVRKLPTDIVLEQFGRVSARFLERFPDSNVEFRRQVHLWRGEYLASREPRQAYLSYEAAAGLGVKGVRERMDRLELLAQFPPAIDHARWLGGDKPKPKSARDKVVLWVFLSSSSPETTRILRKLNELHKRYRRDTLVVLLMASSIRGEKAPSPKWLEHFKLPFRIALDRPLAGGGGSHYARAFRIRSMPWAVLVDRSGRIRRNDTIAENLFARLEEQILGLMAEPRRSPLVQALKKGGEAGKRAFEHLERLPGCVSLDIMLEAREVKMPDSLRRPVRKLVYGRLPPDLLAIEKQKGAEEARRVWRKNRAGYWYDLRSDRLLKR